MVLLLLSWAAVYIVSFEAFKMSFSLPVDVVALFCIVPMILGATIAFEKRENVSSNLMGLKAQCFAFHLSMQSYDKTGESGQEEVRRLFQEFLGHVRRFCSKGEEEFSSVNDDSSKVNSADHLAYDCLAEIAVKIEAASVSMGHAGQKGGEANIFLGLLSGILVTWEQLKAARQNEPPRGLAHFTLAVSHVLPIVLAPYWSSFCRSMHGHLGITSGHGCSAAYFVSALFTVAVFALWRLQNELSDPFDGEGPDDIPWEKWQRQIGDMGRFGPGRQTASGRGRLLLRLGASLKEVRGP